MIMPHAGLDIMARFSAGAPSIVPDLRAILSVGMTDTTKNVSLWLLPIQTIMHKLPFPIVTLLAFCLLSGGCGPQKSPFAAADAWDTVICAWYTLPTPVPLQADAATSARFPQEVRRFLKENDCRTGQTANGSLQVSANVFVYVPDIVCSTKGAAEEAARSMEKAADVKDFSCTSRDTVWEGRQAVLQKGHWVSVRKHYAFRSLLAAENSVLWQFIVLFDSDIPDADACADRILSGIRLKAPLD